MSRVLILGIDAMDAALLSRYEGELPNLRKIRDQNRNVRLTSVYPPDTPTAWASAYTGLDPAKHGIIYFVDPLDKVSILASMDLSSDPIRGQTFWDIAGSHGKRVCILLPFLGHPAWSVNGVMVGRTTNRYSKGPRISCHPASIRGQVALDSLDPIFSVPSQKYFPSYISAYRRLVRAETELGLRMMRMEKWDIFFLYSSALDWVGHNLWSYLDPTDPAHPGPNRYQDTLKDFYKLYDDMVGSLVAEVGPDTSVIIFSDHGFAQRPSRLLNLNEVLREEGLLVPRLKRGDRKSPIYIFDLIKRTGTKILNRRGAGPRTMWLLHHLPSLRRRFTVPQFINWDETAAYLSDLSGVKAYSYGGIIISRDKLAGRSYEEVRQRLIARLEAIADPEGGSRLVKWARPREELYSGPHISKYPDIVFQLREDYGAGWSIYQPLTATSPTHNIQPGTHRVDGAVLLVSSANGAKVNREDLTLMDIAPTVLSILKLPLPAPLDGRSFLRG